MNPTPQSQGTRGATTQTELAGLISTQAQVDFANKLARERDGSTADFEIVCKGQIFKVHRLVISMHSDYFKRLCEGDFRESGERSVTLHGDSLASVTAMVDWIYTFDYSEPGRSTFAKDVEDAEDPEPCSVLELHSHIFTLADKYNLESLQDVALRKVQSHAKGPPGVVSRQFLSRLADDFIPATRHVFNG